MKIHLETGLNARWFRLRQDEICQQMQGTIDSLLNIQHSLDITDEVSLVASQDIAQGIKGIRAMRDYIMGLQASEEEA